MVYRVIITKNLHQAPYHMVNHWNRLVTLFYSHVSVNLLVYTLDNVCRTGGILFQPMASSTEARWLNLRHGASMYVHSCNVHKIAVLCKVCWIYE